MYTEQENTPEEATMPIEVYRFFEKHDVLELLTPDSIFPSQLIFDEECEFEIKNFGNIHGSYIYNPIDFEFDIHKTQSPYQKLEWQLNGKYLPKLFNLEPDFVKGYLERSGLTQIPLTQYIDIYRTLIFHKERGCILSTITEAIIPGYGGYKNYSPRTYREPQYF